MGLLLVTGSMLLVWMSEIITENIYTSGTSLILSFTTILDEIVRLSYPDYRTIANKIEFEML